MGRLSVSLCEIVVGWTGPVAIAGKKQVRYVNDDKRCKAETKVKAEAKAKAEATASATGAKDAKVRHGGAG
jgi:hypothetical protein